jgi:hypothetical protein
MKKKYFSEEERKLAKKLQDKKYRDKNREVLLQKKKEYYKANKEKHSLKMSEHYRQNSEHYKQKTKEWKEANKDKHNALCMLRYTKKLNATPSWLSSDDLWIIQEAYSLAKLREQITGVKWHVDHIVPLQGKTVCGLHVPWNLQVITASENCSKRNKF